MHLRIFRLQNLPVQAGCSWTCFNPYMNLERRVVRALASAGVFISTAALVGLFTTISPSLASYDGGGSGTAQTLGASVTSVEKCAYSLSGVATSLALTASKSYNPDDNTLVSLTASDSGVAISAYPGGNPATACSFYGNSSAGRVSVQVPTTPTWTGTTSGTTLTWTNISDNKLNITPSAGADCTSSGAVLSTLGLYTGNVSGSLVAISSSSSPKACTFGASVNSLMPKNLNAPQGTKVYAITGPTITYTLSLS